MVSLVYKGIKVAHIVAVGKNGEIGANDKLLWHIPEDFKFFKSMTLGRVLLMGRKTVDSLPKPLPQRMVICVSRNKHFKSQNHMLHPLPLSVAVTNAHWHSANLNSDTIFIAGGAQLYNSTFDIVDELYVTHVDAEYPEADTFYHVPEGFVKTGDVIPTTQSVSGLKFRVSKYERLTTE